MDALIVASTPSRQHALTDVLHHEQINSVVCSTAAEARRALLSRPFDLFVVYSGLSDEQGNELAIAIADTNDCGGIYIGNSISNEQIEEQLNACGIITMSLPISKLQLVEAVRLLLVSNARVRLLKAKNEQLTAKLDDLKYISRAKIALMRSLGFSEEQSHKYIEKRAMEMRMSRRKVAIEILKTYEEN